MATGTGMPPADLPSPPEQVALVDIDGEPVMHFHLELAADQLRAMLDANPQFTEAGMSDRMLGSGSIAYDFYVTETNFLRRVDMSMDASAPISMRLDMWPLDPAYRIALPDPAVVQDLEMP